MKTSIHKNIMKKLTITFMIAFASLITAENVKAQGEPVNAGTLLMQKSMMKEDSVNSFISFSPVFVDGKTYVRWLVKNDKKDGLFIVERSDDGVDFEALGFKDRIGTQLLVNLFYSFVDEDPFPGQTHYRVMQVGADNTFKYSDIVKVNTSVAPNQIQNSAAAPEKRKK